MNRSQKQALAKSNYDLFKVSPSASQATLTVKNGELPDIDDLYWLFGAYNKRYFNGQLPPVTIEYSTRMLAAGMYLPARRTIRIGVKYHTIYPEEITDTLKHEMIHVLHLRHDARFRAEAARIGASVKAKSHPDLRKPPRYVYICPNCGREYPRQKQLRMASCGVCTVGRKYDSRYKLRRLDEKSG